MALEIRENRGIFEILGNVSSQNLGALRVYFETIMESGENIVINLENINTMDTSSALFFEKLYQEGGKRNVVISIVGRQNKGVMQIMESTNTHYILSADRI